MHSLGWIGRVVAGHWRTFCGIVTGIIAYFFLPHTISAHSRAILAWDIGSAFFLIVSAVLFSREPLSHIRSNAEAQQDGEWVVFGMTLAGAVVSFAALTFELSGVKNQSMAERSFHITLVATTLLVSWLLTHTLFALRYAHEYYEPRGTADIAAGLDFPGDEQPDYWDFFYFALVLGMTFQVSDVDIKSRKFRRLATAHGLVGFLFNTVIVALTVNIAAGLMS